MSNIAQTVLEDFVDSVTVRVFLFSQEGCANAMKLNGNGKSLAVTEVDSKVSQFMKCSMVLVDLLQQDHELRSLERASIETYLRLIEISYKSWKRRKDGI